MLYSEHISFLKNLDLFIRIAENFLQCLCLFYLTMTVIQTTYFFSPMLREYLLSVKKRLCYHIVMSQLLNVDE